MRENDREQGGEHGRKRRSASSHGRRRLAAARKLVMRDDETMNHDDVLEFVSQAGDAPNPRDGVAVERP